MDEEAQAAAADWFAVSRMVTPLPSLSPVQVDYWQVPSRILPVRASGSISLGSRTPMMRKFENSMLIRRRSKSEVQSLQKSPYKWHKARARANADIAISITGIAGPSNDGTNKKVGYVYVGIASRSWAISEATQIGGSRQENKEGFVHFALLTAIRHWDQAMEKAEQNLQDEIKQREEQARIKALEEIARNQRAAAAAESAEWQSQSWSDKAGTSSETNLGTDVEWSDDSANEST